ncbi:MAG: phosphopantetheine adenylyltransferase [Candidatus Bathyarchaeia archaeon]
MPIMVSCLYQNKRGPFRIVGVGGTFDELHKGHKVLLKTAFEYGETVWIGLTTDGFAKKLRKNHGIAPYDVRLRNLMKFLEDLSVSSRAEIVPLDDPYGPAASNPEIEAIVVSRETEEKAREINILRGRRGIKPLEVIVIDMVLAEDQIPISTTRIKRGEINHEGRLIR